MAYKVLVSTSYWVFIVLVNTS